MTQIGFLSLGLESYWPQFEGMRDRLLERHERLACKFEGVSVVDAGMVDNFASAAAAAMRFREHPIEIVFCHLSTYCFSEALLPIIRSHPKATIILLNLQDGALLDLSRVKEIPDWLGEGCTCAGLPEMTAVLRRFGQSFDVITGMLEEDDAANEAITQWLTAASAVDVLNNRAIGMLGRPFQGMLDLSVDEAQLYHTFGTYVRHLDWHDLDFSEQSPQAATRTEIAEVFENFDDFNDNQIEDSVALYQSMRDLAQRHGLIGLVSHFETQPNETLARILSPSNIAFSMLMKNGVACPVEADLKTAVAMCLVKSITGSATLAELYSMDFEADVCLIGHSGAADPDISDAPCQLRESAVFHGKPGSGFLTQFTPRLGPATLCSITHNAAHGFEIVIAEGELVAGPTLALGDTNARFRFAHGLRHFVNNWASCGPSHHTALATGHAAATLEKAARLLAVPVRNLNHDIA